MPKTDKDKSATIDKLDTRIIDILKGDGRMSNAVIARTCSVSEGTIRRRLSRLLGEGIIDIVALPDPVKIGLSFRALIGVQVDPDRIEQVADDLSDLDEIGWVIFTTGTFDVFAWVAFPTPEELGVFLRTKVGSIPGVRHTETFVNLANKKRGVGVVA